MARLLKIALLFSILALGGLVLIARDATTRTYEAALVLADIAAKDGPSRLKARTPMPVRSPVTYGVNGRRYQGDLYLPGDKPRAGIVLIPGVAERGKDDPRLTAFATTLARAQFAVLVPDLSGLRTFRIGSRDVRQITDAFTFLVSRPDLVPHGKAGICSFSYASGPAMLAALDPAIRDRVRFILSIGGYYDLPRLLTFATTGWFQEDRQWHHRTPSPYAKWVFALGNAEHLPDPIDRQLFRSMFERKKEDSGATVDDLASRLSPYGKRLYDLIANTDLQQVQSLLARLPEPIRKEIAALNLADKDLSHVAAHLILVHGLDDDIIPYTESMALARAFPKGKARLFVTKGLAHVNVKATLLESWWMWRVIDTLLRERC
jgi:hypothetical protein